MTVKELFVQILKDYPEGLWVHFIDGHGERYLDEEYEVDFSDVLSREVIKWFLDECDYDILEIKLK